LARLIKLKGNMNTADLIQRLIEKANYHDTFGRTDEGDILREAAAALAEAKNADRIRGMIQEILLPTNHKYTSFIHPEGRNQ
jgi:predicted CopG family antitoxin